MMHKTVKNNQVIEKTMRYLEQVDLPGMMSDDRYKHALRFIQQLDDLRTTQAAMHKLARLSVAEYEARFTSIYFDLSQSTDSLLVIRDRLTGETKYFTTYSINSCM